VRSLPLNSLSRERRQLLRWLRELSFGWVEGLQVRDGEPVVSPAPKRVREVKLQGESVRLLTDAELEMPLREPELELLKYFDQVQNVTIERLLVKYSMPFKADAIEPKSD
jgi:hypothetical protein